MATVTLSVKNVPKVLASNLKARAERNHRSLQGELLAILTEAAETVSVTDLHVFARQLKLRSRRGTAAAIIRADRDDPRR